MNTLRILAVVAAVLITAGLFGVVGYGQTVQQHAAANTSVHTHATAD
jgi:hypothetical protein